MSLPPDAPCASPPSCSTSHDRRWLIRQNALSRGMTPRFPRSFHDRALALKPWIQRSTRRTRIIMGFHQPMTVHQIARSAGQLPDTCSKLLAELCERDLVFCLNRASGRHRLYWLTGLGLECRALLDDSQPIAMLRSLFPTVDWQLYGAVCFRHRAAVIKTLRCPMRPSEIKRRLRLQTPSLRISANNIRDVIRYLRQEGVVRPIRLQRRGYPAYELTAVGEDLYRLLTEAESR